MTVIFTFAIAQVAFASTLPQLFDLTPQTTHVASELSQSDASEAEIVERSEPGLENLSGTLSPEALTDERPVPVQIAVSTNFTITLQADGTLWAWGNNDFGQLGLGDTDSRTVPTLIDDTNISGDEWTAVSAGTNHVLALRDNGELYAWGGNANGRLGIGGTVSQSAPVHVPTAGISGSEWTTISAGGTHSLALRDNGELYVWGGNAQGRLGLGDTNQRTTPVQLPTAGISGSEWTTISAGDAHTLAIRDSGELYVWGNGANGRLGLNDPTQRTTPVQLPTAGISGSEWIVASGGNAHTLAIRDDGSMWAWGNNSAGRLGLGDSIQRNVPYEVLTTNVSGGEWVAVSAGNTNTIALRDSGELYVWGANAQGQLGLGDNVTRTSPTVVPTTDISGDEWIALSRGANASHTIVVRDDATAWSWGNNADGQLGKGIAEAGQGTNTDNWVPWRIAASLQSESASDWAVADDATDPYNGEIDVVITTNTLTVRFDRPMRTEVEFRGEIVIDNGAAVNVAAGTWSENDTVFTAPLTLIAGETLHTVTISGFVDTFLGWSSNPMYPHTWTFTTYEDPDFVEGDPILFDSSACGTCHFMDNLKLEHQFVSSRGLTATSNEYDYGCQTCHGQDFASVDGKVDWNNHAPLKMDMLDDAEIAEDGCMACHGGAESLVHGGPGNMLNAHFVNVAVDTGCSESGCHGPRSAAEPTGFGFGAMDFASAHADYWLAVQDGRILSTSVSNSMQDDNPFACGICHARDYNDDSRLRPQIIAHLETTGGNITCTTCHIAPDTDAPNWEVLHLAQREMRPEIVQALDLTISINDLTASDFLGGLSARTRAELNVGAQTGDRLEPGVLGGDCCEELEATSGGFVASCQCQYECTGPCWCHLGGPCLPLCDADCDCEGVECHPNCVCEPPFTPPPPPVECPCLTGGTCDCGDDCNCDPARCTCGYTPPPPPPPPVECPCLTGGMCDCGDDCNCDPARCTCEEEPPPPPPAECPCLTGGTCDCDDCNCEPARCTCEEEPAATEPPAEEPAEEEPAEEERDPSTGPTTGEEANWYLHMVAGSALVATLIVMLLSRMPKAVREEE